MNPIERNPAPNPFRDQYTGGVTPDPEVEAILAGSNTPRVSVPPAPPMFPSSEFQWMNHGAVKLR